MDHITASLNQLGLLQMVLVWAFLACYATALGGLLEASGSWRAAGLALAAAIAFCALADNWVHGALLMMFVVAGMGLFVAIAWLLARVAAWFIGRDTARRPAPSVPAAAPARPQALGVMLRAFWRSQA